MYGLIKAYDPETQTGTITNGKENFNFEIKDWVASAPPEYGDEVAFDLRGVKPYNINLRGALLNKDQAVKSKYIALALAFFLGWAGIHRFYLGYYRVGITQIIVNGLLVVAGMMGYALLWGFVESFLLFSGHLDKDAEGRPLK